ncbi:hypothetical protein ACJMK2_005276 [Sinanodonta woodiana]
MALKSKLSHRSSSETSIKDLGVNQKKTIFNERVGNVIREEVRQPSFKKRNFSDRVNNTSGDGHCTNVKHRHSSGDPKQRHTSNVKDRYHQKCVQTDGHQSEENESYKKCLNNAISIFQSIKKERSSITLNDSYPYLNCEKGRHSKNNEERCHGNDAFDKKDNSSIDKCLKAGNNSIMNVKHSASDNKIGSCPNNLKDGCNISRPLSTKKACKRKEENDRWQVREENESGLKRRHSSETPNEQDDFSSKRLRQCISEPGQPVLKPILFTLDLSQENADLSDGSLPDLDPPTILREDVFSETDYYSYKSPKLPKNGNQQQDLPCNVNEFMDLANKEERSDSIEGIIGVCDDLKGTEHTSTIASLGENSLQDLEYMSDSSSKQRSVEQRDKQLSSSESVFYSEFSYSDDWKSSKKWLRHSQSNKSVRSLWHSISDDVKASCIDDDSFQGKLNSDDVRSFYFQSQNTNITSSETMKICQNSSQIVTSEPSSENSFVSKVTDELSKFHTVNNKEEIKPCNEKICVRDFVRTEENKYERKLHKSQSCNPIMEANSLLRTNIFEAFSYQKDNSRSIPPKSELSPEVKKTLKEKLKLFKTKMKTPLKINDRLKPDPSGGLVLQESSQDSRHFLDVIQQEPTLVDGNVSVFGKVETLSTLPVNLLQKSKLKKLFAAQGLELNNKKCFQASDAKDEIDKNVVLVSDVEHSTSDRKCIDEPKSVMQTSLKPSGEKAVLLPIMPAIPEIKSHRTSITRKVNVSSDSKYGKGPANKKNIKSFFTPLHKSPTCVLISSLETRKKNLIVPSSRFPFESILDSTCKQMTQLHINTIEGCFEEGMLFLSHGLKFLNDVCFRCKPTSDMVGRIVTSSFQLQDKNVSTHLVQYAYKTLMIINQVYPGLIQVNWVLIEDCLKGIVSSRSCESSTGTQTQACLLLSLLTDVLLDDLFNRDISDQKQIQSSMAFKVLSYDTSRSNIEVIVDYIRCILCGISDHAISAGLAQGSPNGIEYKVLPILQRLLDLAVNVSRSCEDCATYIGTRLLQMYIYLPGLGHKSLLLQTIMSDLLALKLSQLVLEKEYDNIMPLGGFPDSLGSVFESFFSAVPYKNHLTPPTTPTSDNEDNGVARSSTDDIIEPTTCEELCMLLFYSVKSYLLSSQGKVLVAFLPTFLDRMSGLVM